MTPISRTRLRRAIRSPRLRLVTRLVVGLGILVAVIARVGAGPVLRGLASLDWRTIAAALVLAAVATAAAAWRWHLIANRLGVGLRWSTAIGLYYQSQFLNTVLPGGIIGDAHRAVAHGSRADSIRQTARSVAIERTAGQAVQLTLGLGVAAVFGAEFAGYVLSAIAIGVAVIGTAVVVTTALSKRGRRLLRREVTELRAGLGSARDCLKVTAASVPNRSLLHHSAEPQGRYASLRDGPPAHPCPTTSRHNAALYRDQGKDRSSSSTRSSHST